MAHYLLYGKERLLKREFIFDLRSRLLGNSPDASLNFQEFSGKKNEIAQALDFVSTAPFLSENRLAVLWEADSLAPEGKASLVQAMAKIPRTGNLVVVTDETNTKKSSLLKELVEICESVPCHTPFEKDIPRWVDKRAQRFNKRISVEAVGILTSRVGTDLSAIASAIESLAVYTAAQKEIFPKDVQDLLGRSAEEDVFRLTDLLVEGNTVRALEVLDGLFAEGVRSYEIVAGLASQLERLKKASEFKEKGHSLQEAAARSGVHPFYQDKFIAQLRQLSSERIDESLRMLLFYDEAVKTGQCSERLAVETFLMAAISPRSGS